MGDVVLVQRVTRSRINFLSSGFAALCRTKRKLSGMTCICFFLIALPARAESYAETTFDNLAHTLVRFNVFDIKDDSLIDDYAMITDCDLFKAFYKDDFKWNQVRKAIRESIRLNIATYPIAYYYTTTVRLDRYNFKFKNFGFDDSATIRGINVFQFFQGTNFKCDKFSPKNIPVTYRAFLDQPVSIDDLPIGEEDARDLLHRMDGVGNTKHTIYAKFLLRVVNIDPLRQFDKFDGKEHFTQSMSRMDEEIHLDVRLDAVNFYEDQEMTRLLYSYRP